MTTPSTAPTLPAAVHTLVVGAGFAGLAAAAAVLRADPEADLLIHKRADEVSGRGATTRTPDARVTYRRRCSRLQTPLRIETTSAPPGLIEAPERKLW